VDRRGKGGERKMGFSRSLLGKKRREGGKGAGNYQTRKIRERGRRKLVLDARKD